MANGCWKHLPDDPGISSYGQEESREAVDPCETGTCNHPVHCTECGVGMDYPTKSGICDECFTLNENN